MNDVLVFTVLGMILLFIFFVFLLLRRTAQGFKEGMQGK
jgi:flagellar biogenesis protein FliO